MPCAGETYLYPLSGTPHLWIIATEPDEDGVFAIVNLTSLKGSHDQTVTIRRGEHEFVKWDTCVLYAFAELTNVERLQTQIECGNAKMHSPLSLDLLRLVVDGFSASEFTKRRVCDYVKARKRG